MNLEARKQELLVVLENLRRECETLMDRISTYKEDLLKVKTEQDVKEFDETHDLEEGFRHICIFS